MFGRNREILDCTVRPTKEGQDLLAEQALDRIEVVDGIDYLDGYKVPPNDEEIFDPKTMTAHCMYWTEHEGEFYFRTEIHEFESKLTNRWIRERNIHAIAQGIKPLFRKWEDVTIDWEQHQSQRKGLFSTLGDIVLRRGRVA